MKGQVKIIPVLIITLFIAGLSAYYIFSKRNINSAPSSSENITSTSSPATVSSSPSVTAGLPTDWKTYQNRDYNFTIKYPENYLVEERVKGFFVVKTQTENTPQGGISLDFRGHDPKFTDVNTAIDYYKQSLSDLSTSTTDSWNIINGTGTEPMVTGLRFLYAVHNDKPDVVIESLDVKPYNQIFLQILSSVKFG